MKKQILIYDDDQGILTTMKYLLEDEGYEVHTAETAHEFHENLLRKPDAIILDYYLPYQETSGIVKGLKSSIKTKHTPVFLMSANHTIGDIVKETGADGFLRKPFVLTDLKTLLHSA